jgi:hypothetical protein
LWLHEYRNKKFTEIKEVLRNEQQFTEIIISVLKIIRRSTKIVSYDENYKIIKITQ